MVITKPYRVLAPSISDSARSDTSPHEYVWFWWISATFHQSVHLFRYSCLLDLLTCFRYDDPDASYTQLYGHRVKRPKTNAEGSVVPIIEELSTRALDPDGKMQE